MAIVTCVVAKIEPALTNLGVYHSKILFKEQVQILKVNRGQ